MKKVSFLICMAIAALSFSFTVPASAPSGNVVVDPIQFKVFNDTGAAFEYSVDNQHYTIAANHSAGFSYEAGTVIHKWTNGAQGDAWLTVTATMHGNSFQLSALLQ